MVNFPKSNWMKYSLFLLPVAMAVSSLNASSANKKPENFVKIEDQPAFVQEVSETVGRSEAVKASEAKTPDKSSGFATASGLAIKIDAIGVNIPLTTTTLGKNRELLVPANPNTAGWYKNGPQIGEAGTALITGHYDTVGRKPGIFYNLRKLNPNDIILVRRADGKIATYKIDKLASYPQNNTFPWNKVYSTSGPSSLRLITCDGEYNSKTGRYSRNLVVYASMISLN